MKPGDQFYLRMERKNDKQLRHKHVPIVDGSYHVTTVDSSDSSAKTVASKRRDHIVENVSRNCLVLTPKGKTKTDLMDTGQVMQLTEIFSDYPCNDYNKLLHINRALLTPEIASE